MIKKISNHNLHYKINIFLVFFLVLNIYLIDRNLARAENRQETYKQLNLFGDVFQRVQEQYVEEVTDKKLIEAAISGMLQSLDPHSSYLSPESYKDMQVKTKGKFGGLGIEITMEDGVVKVVSPIDDTPAANAGMKSGDLIIGINGDSISGLSINEGIKSIRFIEPVSEIIILENVKSPWHGPVGILKDICFSIIFLSANIISLTSLFVFSLANISSTFANNNLFGISCIIEFSKFLHKINDKASFKLIDLSLLPLNAISDPECP